MPDGVKTTPVCLCGLASAPCACHCSHSSKVGGEAPAAGLSKGPFCLQVWQLALAIGVGLSGPRWGILFHEVLSEVWASLQPLM